jgi:CBS domain-containing protein
MQVSEILRVKGTTLYTVTPDTMLSDCVIVMADARVQREQRAGPTPPVAEFVVRDVMNPEPIVATPDMDVNDLRRSMIDTHQRYLPVMDDGTLLGVVSFHDVARAVLEEQSFENRMLKAYIRDWPSEG